MDVVNQKKVARKQVKQALRDADPKALAAQSEAICQNILSLPAFQEANTVVAYLTCPNLREVDTGLIIKDCLSKCRKLFVPVVEDRGSNMRMMHLDNLDDLESVPPFGILEPKATYADGSPRQSIADAEGPVDIIILPGQGFDKSGNRLGRGGGYYDKFLNGLDNGSKSPCLIGLCFQEQILDAVPMEGHDQKCAYLATPDGLIQCT